MSCEICTHADETGSWADLIPALTHCRRCCGSWPRQSEYQHCVGCCQTFTTIKNADRHTCGVDPAVSGFTRATRGLREGATETPWVWAEAAERLRAAFSRKGTPRAEPQNKGPA